jgi:hypothetical protein
MQLFLFGAGSTMGTLGLPGVEQFGREFERLVPDWRTSDQYRELARFVGEFISITGAATWRLDHFWRRLDYVAKLGEAIKNLGMLRDRGDASRELHRAVAAVYGPLDEAALERAWRSSDPFTLRDILGQVQAGDAVVSLNWDVLVEWLLVNCRLRGTAARAIQAPHARDASDVLLVKPHGSLSWRRPMQARTEPAFAWCNADGSPLTRAMTGADVSKDEHADIFYQPLLLGAVPVKSEVIREVQANQPHVHAHIIEQWRALCEALRDADELQVIGYSFPDEDAYGHFVLEEAARARDRIRTPLRVRLYEVDCKHKEVAERIGRTLNVDPNAVEAMGPVRAPDDLRRR